MRFAFFSDIHANFQALELILADIRRQRVDQVVCLGDVASLGPQPRETVECLQELRIPVIMGNHDAYLLDLRRTDGHDPWLRDAEKWAREKLDDAHIEFLRSFQPSLHFTVSPSLTVFCFHGSPHSNEEFLFPTASPIRLDLALAGEDAPVMVCGHTHVQMLRRHRGTTLINPGSAGMPFEYPQRGRGPRILPWADYAILDIDANGMHVDLRRLRQDFARMVEVTLASGMPEAEKWLSTWAAPAP